MKKALLVGALLALVATPAMAQVVYTPVALAGQPGGNPFTIGLVDNGNPGTLNVANVYYPASSLVQLTFGMHFGATPFSFYYWTALHFSFFYDNNEVSVVGARPTGPWAGAVNNYSGFAFPNPSSGGRIINTLSQIANSAVGGFTDGSGVWVVPGVSSSVQPFFQVTLHLKNPVSDGFLDFGINPVATTGGGTVGGMTAVSYFATSTTGGGLTPIQITPFQWAYAGGEVHTPEPTSAALLAGGLLAIGGGLIRRRRMA